MDYNKIPYVAAHKAAENREREAPSGLTVDWLKNLSGGARVPLGEVIDLLAFGNSMSPDGLSDVEAETKRIIASNTLFRPAASESVQIFGTRAELLPGLIGTIGCRQLAPPGHIDPSEFENGRLTLSPVGGCICLAEVAAGHFWDWQRVSYLDVSIRFINLFVDRDSLAKWIGEVTKTKARYTTPAQHVVRKIARKLWPNGGWESLPVQVRNNKIKSEAKNQRIGLTLDPKTIKRALGA